MRKDKLKKQLEQIKKKLEEEEEKDKLPPLPTFKETDNQLQNKKIPIYKYNVTEQLPKRERKYLKKNPSRTFIVVIELNNGMEITLAAIDKEGIFEFDNKDYIIIPEMKRYNCSLNNYVLYYHENFCLPIIKKIHDKELRIPLNKNFETTQIIDAITSSDYKEIEYATSPKYIYNLINAKLGEQLAKGAQIDEFFKSIKTFIIITLIIGILTFIVSIVIPLIANRNTG